MLSDLVSWCFVFGILIVFLLVVVIGVMVYGFIKEVLFEILVLICMILLIGGVIFLWIDWLLLMLRYINVMDYLLLLCLKIGIC